jgi:hypothetical protein
MITARNSFVAGEGHAGESVGPPESGRVVAVPQVCRPRAAAERQRAEGDRFVLADGFAVRARCGVKEQATWMKRSERRVSV